MAAGKKAKKKKKKLGAEVMQCATRILLSNYRVYNEGKMDTSLCVVIRRGGCIILIIIFMIFCNTVGPQYKNLLTLHNLHILVDLSEEILFCKNNCSYQ